VIPYPAGRPNGPRRLWSHGVAFHPVDE
jgi:hypothetical protein